MYDETMNAAREFKAAADEVKRFAEAAHAELKNLGRADQATRARMDAVEQKMARRGSPGGDSGAGAPSLGMAFVESEQFKALASSGRQRGEARIETTRAGLEFKSITTAAGSGAALLPPDFRPDPVALPYRRLAIRDLVAPGQTIANSVTYPKMTSRTMGAATVAEGSLKPASDLGFVLVTSPVTTLAHTFTQSRQIMDDAPALRSLIDVEARYGLRFVEDQQLLFGDGTGVNLLGLMPQAQTFAAPFSATGDTALDKILQAIAQVEEADYECDGMVLNSLDWNRMRSIKNTQGTYLSAGPFGPENSRNLWDIPVAITNNMPTGAFLVGAFRTGAQIFDRMAVEVLMSTEHADYFARNLVMLRCEERLAFTVQRPRSFVTGTF